MKKDVLRNKLDTIKLPIDKPDTKKAPETYDKHYLTVLEELGVKTRADIDKLREAVDDKIVQMSDELRMQTLQDLMSGKIKDITQVPLYRDGNSIRNIPDNFAPWIGFIAWLNERRTALFEE